MKYKLIVSDLDGTLLDERQRIPAATARLLQEFVGKGGLVTIATGRTEESVKWYCEHLEIDIPVILYNGAKIVDLKKEKAIYEKKLDAKSARTAMDCFRRRGWDIIYYADGGAYVERMNAVIEGYIKKDNIKCCKVDSLDTILYDMMPVKLLTIADKDEIDEFLKTGWLERNSFINAVRSENTYFEILPWGVSKGKALRKLAKYLNISLTKTVAFGDNQNDIEMIKAAGVGVAVANAHPSLRDCADIITETNENEGVARVIEIVLAGKKLNKTFLQAI